MIGRALVSRWTLALSMMMLLACSRGSSARASTPAPEARPSGSGSTRETSPAATAAPAMPQSEPATGAAPGGAAPTEGASTQQGEPRSGTANPFDEHGSVAANTGGSTDCQRDDDCICGIDRSTGACAIGPASRVDSARQCPDFCSGIGGQLRVVCDHGRCTQR